jgi:hypothetical protein
MNLELQILQALQAKPLSTRELSEALGSPIHGDFNQALHVLRTQKYWIAKQPVFSGGCKTCACGVTYAWRLTISGRAQLREANDQEGLHQSSEDSE